MTSTHGYGAVRKALDHQAARAGARVVEAVFPVGAADDDIVSAYARACSPRTRLVVVDRITSPTATVVPVAAVAAAVRAAAGGADVRVLVDAAHAPGQLRDDIAALGADHWVGNLHKWAYTPRGSAILWSRPGTAVTPTVLSWQLEDGYAASFDYPGTWDYAGWLAVGDGLAYWADLGGWDAVSGLAALVTEGQKNVAEALDVSLDRLPVTPAPRCGWCRCPTGVLAAARSGRPVLRGAVAAAHRGRAGLLRRRRLPAHRGGAVQHPGRLRPPGRRRPGTARPAQLGPAFPLDGTAKEGGQLIDGGSAVRYRLLGRERPGGEAAKLIARLGNPRLRSWLRAWARPRAATLSGKSGAWPVARARSQPWPRNSVIRMPASAVPGTCPNGSGYVLSARPGVRSAATRRSAEARKAKKGSSPRWSASRTGGSVPVTRVTNARFPETR